MVEFPAWDRGKSIHEYKISYVLIIYEFIFLDVVEIQDDDNSLAMLYQTMSELPQPNRDTLACLMIHLQK